MSTWEIGKIGERIIEEYLKNSNWLTYPAPDKRHPIDWFLATKDKKHVCISDAKTKPRREKYADTGINLTHYHEYEYLKNKYNVNALLIFVDPILRKIYGNYIYNLTQHTRVDGKDYPSVETTRNGIPIIYFPLVSMKEIEVVSEEHAEELNGLSRRNYEYNGDFEPVIMQPALFNSPYKPKYRMNSKPQYDDPKFLKQLLLVKTCLCGQDNLNPNLHDDYCEYKQLLTKELAK